MPAIYILHRRTLLGGDDLQPAALMSLILRFLQLTLFLGPVIYQIVLQSTLLGGFVNFVWYGPTGNHKNNNNNSNGMDPSNNCRQSHLFGLLLSIYALLSALAGLGSIFLERRLAYWSSQGCPVHHIEPRSSKVTSLLEFKLIPMNILVFLVWVTGVVSTAYATNYYFCIDDDMQQILFSDGTQSLWWIAFAFLSFSQILEVIVSSTYLLLLLSMPPERPRPSSSSSSLITIMNGSTHNPTTNNNGGGGIAVGMLSTPTRTDAATASSTVGAASAAATLSNRSRTNTQDSWAYDYANNHELVEEMWADRCSQLCQCLSKVSCFMFGGHELFHLPSSSSAAAARNAGGGGGTGGVGGAGAGAAQFGDVARALADYLETRGVLDVVPSDIATGFLVLQRLQRQRMQQARREVIHASNNSLNRGESASSSSILIPTTTPTTPMPTTTTLQQQQQQQHPLINNNTGNCKNDSSSSSSSNASFCSCHQTMDPLDAALPASPLPTLQQPQSSPPSQSAMRSTMMAMAAASRNNNNNISGSTFSTSLYRLDSMGNVQRLSRSILRQTSPLDMQVLEEGARYARYALAIYTWVLYLYVHPVSGIPRLLWKRTKDKVQRICRGNNNINNNNDIIDDNNNYVLSNNHRSRLEGDNFWQTHKTALLLTAGLSEADLVYAQLKSGFRENPYCILLDHEWRSVVVSVRGTFSLEDCVTDVLIEPESLEPLGREFGFDATNQYCHGGVLSCVRNVYRDLQRHGLLERLLLGENALYPGYTLRLVGHSLGAATCTILSFMLRPTFPSLRCVNYSPPGCSITWEMAVQCQEWCSSFVLDADLVPRLSLDSMERLRDEILELIARIKVPKIQVAQVLMAKDGNRHNSYSSWRSYGGYGYGGVDRDSSNNNSSEHSGSSSERMIEEILYHPDQVPDSEYVQQLARFKCIQIERRASRGSIRSIKLYPPGKMVHLVKTAESKSCCHGLAKCLTCFANTSGFEYIPVWIANDDLNEIVIEPTMGTDHFPNRIQFMLEQVARDFGLNVR